jgi:pimeloyl-ACP methyl ester carboxylesterase
MRAVSATTDIDGAFERIRVVAHGPNGPVPSLLWRHTNRRGARPLALLGHGGAGHKETKRWITLAKMFGEQLGADVLLIDGPYHGERLPREGSLLDRWREVKERASDPEVPTKMAQDWRAAVDAAKEHLEPVPTDVVYVGYSMGAICGVHAVAAMPEVRAAVFGVGGLPKRGGLAEFLKTLGIPARLAANIAPVENHIEELHRGLLDAASRLGHCDVLMINATRDEIFPLDGALRLLEAFPGRKRFFLWPGTHTNIPNESFAYALDFLRRALGQIQETLTTESAW